MWASMRINRNVFFLISQAWLIAGFFADSTESCSVAITGVLVSVLLMLLTHN